MVEASVPAGRIFDAEDMLADPHFTARDALVTVADAEFGAVTMKGVFPKISATPGGVRRHAPRTVGQDGDDALTRWLALAHRTSGGSGQSVSGSESIGGCSHNKKK